MKTEKVLKPMKKITGILDILICLLLFISSLYKGCFYKEDSLFVNLVICMLGLACLSVKLIFNITDNRKITKSKLGTFVDICVILMPIVYFLPVIFGTYASRENAIFESIRYVNFAIIYFIVRTTSNKKVYLTSIVIIGVILAMLGIDELTYRALEQIINPISINYLSANGGKLSSTLQYANVTALFMLISSIILQDKLAKNLPNLNNKSTYKFKFLVISEIFSLVLLQSAIILTTSRMNTILMFITSVIYSIACLKNGKKKSALMVVLMLIAAFALVTSIDNYLLSQNYFMIWITYILTFLITALLVILGGKFKIEYTIDKNNKEVTKRFWLILTICIIVILSILTMPTKLRVSSTTEEESTVTRNIYTKLEETMDVEITLAFNKNNKFVLELYEIDKDFNKQMVVSITEKSIKNNKYTETIKLSKTAESLMFNFTAINSDITIEEFKLNKNKVTLSYMFIPDTIVFRLRDTLIKDSNNKLRYTYYEDALKLFAKSPIVGLGGEGFQARYQEVQESPYISSEEHSMPLKILVESGIIGFITFLSLCIVTFVILFRLIKNKKEDSLLYLLLIISFIVTATFDLVFSFGIMIYIFAIIIGLIIGEYKKNVDIDKDIYELDNKSVLGMLKIATLSISLMALILITIYSINIYNASMISVTDKTENIDESYERVGILENKVKLDKYNLAYLNNLLSQYDTHIELLNKIYIMTQAKEEKDILQNEINSYIIKQKEIADRIIECDYYNKYAIDMVARCYFKHYISYANIYNENFKNDEIAYVFYIGYAIKLTERIIDIGSVNKVAHNLAYNIYNEYIPVIENHNNILKDKKLNQAIQDMKQNKESLKQSVE